MHDTVWTLVGLFSMFEMTNYDLIVSVICPCPDQTKPDKNAAR